MTRHSAERFFSGAENFATSWRPASCRDAVGESVVAFQRFDGGLAVHFKIRRLENRSVAEFNPEALAAEREGAAIHLVHEARRLKFPSATFHSQATDLFSMDSMAHMDTELNTVKRMIARVRIFYF